jgi:hypothetical protein
VENIVIVWGVKIAKVIKKEFKLLNKWLILESLEHLFIFKLYQIIKSAHVKNQIVKKSIVSVFLMDLFVVRIVNAWVVVIKIQKNHRY